MKVIITELKEVNIPNESEYKVIKPPADNGEKMKNCIGCFGCWMKTPGKCVIHDGFEGTGSYLGNCSELIFISECCYGSTSPFVKSVMDRAISYVHPNFVKRNGEMHHKRRYDNIISLKAYFYGENITEEEKNTAARLMKANIINFDGIMNEILFFETSGELISKKVIGGEDGIL